MILKQTQSPGDVLTFTRAVADLSETYPDWEIDVRTPCPEIWENNPRITPLPDGEVHDIRYDSINDSGWRGHHFSDGFREDLEKKLGVPIQSHGIRPEIWVSDLEKTWINQAEAEFGWHGPFWLLNAGSKPDNELKQYGNWQVFVDAFNDHFGGSVRLVQIGHKSHHHPDLDGVYSLVGKTDLRQLIRLAWWAHGSIGPISFQMVLSAALEQPAVCVAGGKEGVRWHLYPNMRWLSTNGALECCKWDGCWLGGPQGKCKDRMPDGSPRCFSLITPWQILEAVDLYYQGGVLQTGVRGK